MIIRHGQSAKNSGLVTWAQIKDPEEVTNKMCGCNIDIDVTLSGSLICARVGDVGIGLGFPAGGEELSELDGKKSGPPGQSG